MVLTTITERLRPFAAASRMVPLLAIFITVFGSKLWLIQRFGSDVPFWDQWNAEGINLYKPLLERGLGAVDWLSAHNEHRILLARLSSALLLWINVQWDPLFQMCWEAICAAAIAMMIAISTGRLLPDDQNIVVVWALALLGTAMPYGWENSLAGFQTPFYYLVLISLAMFHLCAYRGSLSTRRSVVITILGGLSLLTLASGALTCLAAVFSLVARLLFRRGEETKRVVGLIVILLVWALIGFGTTPTVAAHAGLRAHSFLEARTVFATIIGWPSGLGIVVWLPFFAWALQVVRRRKIDPAGLLLVALAAFVFLNAAATATARAASIQGVVLVSRYTDFAWLAWLVNLLALLLFFRRTPDHRQSDTGRVLIAIGFVYASLTLLGAGRTSLTDAADRGNFYAMETENTRNYVTTGNPAALVGKISLQIPFPDAEQLIHILDDPTVRSLLPPGIRPGIIKRSGATLDALTRNGLVLTGVPPLNPAAPPPDLGYFYGTWGKEGNGHVARFVSESIEAQGTTISTLVSGYLGQPGLSLYLEDVESGKRVSILPDKETVKSWEIVRVEIPGPTYRLIAEDTATGDAGWFAFTDPVELGRFRWLTELLTRNGERLTVFGIFLFIAGILVFPRRRQADPEDESHA